MQNITTSTKQRGAVSLFVVIFAMLIITVLTVSFLRLMMSDQNQATNANLAEGARHSALAGVEDAKRALLRYTEYCKTNTPLNCAALATDISSDVCNQAVRVGDVVGSDVESGGTALQPGEIRVQQSLNSDDTLLDQAYTCVTIDLNTDDYIGTVGVNATQMIPLVGTAAFDQVRVEWFSREDIGSTSASTAIDLPSSTARTLTSTWPSNRPPLLRVQHMQVGDSFRLEDFDITTSSSGVSRSNTNTLFLYPTSNGSTAIQSFTARDTRKSSLAAESPADPAIDVPLGVRCQASLSGGGFACSTTLVLPSPIGTSERSTAFLRIVPFYNATHFKVTLLDGASGDTIQFRGVQPEIDSTGRANSVFKRVSSRVDLYNMGFVFPSAAVDVTNNFCKDFAVTDVEYVAGTCTP